MIKKFNKIFRTRLNMLDWLNQELLNENIIGFRILHHQDDRDHESLVSHFCEGEFIHKKKEVSGD